MDLIAAACSGVAASVSAAKARTVSIRVSGSAIWSKRPQASAVAASSFTPPIRIILARAGPKSRTRRGGSEGCGKNPSFITG